MFTPMGFGFVVGVLLVAWAALLYFRPARRKHSKLSQLSIQVDTSDLKGPNSLDGPQLLINKTPMRLLTVVIAPIGPKSPMPSLALSLQIISQTIFRFGDVFQHQQPNFRAWPGQPSIKGFEQQFFVQAALPGDQGKSTRWTAVCGKAFAKDQGYLIGLIGIAEQDNLHGRIVVEDDRWGEVIEVRDR